MFARGARDGWTTWTYIGGTFTPTWASSNGNPGGCISQSDPDNGYFYFRAPAKFLGSKSAAFNGTGYYANHRATKGDTGVDVVGAITTDGEIANRVVAITVVLSRLRQRS